MENNKIAKGNLINYTMPSNTFRAREVNTIFNAGPNILQLYNTIANKLCI